MAVHLFRLRRDGPDVVGGTLCGAPLYGDPGTERPAAELPLPEGACRRCLRSPALRLPDDPAGDPVSQRAMHLEYRLGMEASREEVRGAAEAGDAPGVRRGIRAARRRMTLARSPEARSLDRRAAACVRRIGRDAGLLGEAFGAAAAARVLREAADGLLSGRHPKKV